MARLFTSRYYGLDITGYAATVPEKNMLHPFTFFLSAGKAGPLLTRKVETPARAKMQEALGDTTIVLSLPGVPAATVHALRVELWFTRQILEALVEEIAGKS
jgi:hypothetical protein